MAQSLKLAFSQPTPVRRCLRPFATFYYGPRATLSQWSHRGNAGSVRGAILAATRQLVDGRAKTALVHDEDGVVIARLERTPTALRIVCVGWEGA